MSVGRHFSTFLYIFVSQIPVHMMDKRIPNIIGLFLLLFSVTFLEAQEVRSINGSNNNLQNPDWGAAGSQLIRIVPNAYLDGISQPTGENRPNPRDISNTLFSQNQNFDESSRMSDFVWVFGQFLDHDITLVLTNSQEPTFIDVPPCDEIFDPNCEGQTTIPMFRVTQRENTGTSTLNPRGFTNHITPLLDGSSVYGSDNHRANWLRSFTDGKLKISEGNLMPFNTDDGSFNAPQDFTAPEMENSNPFVRKLFVAGDPRANENTVLAAMHTLFVREHNRLCDELKAENPTWTDEQLYQEARRRVGAIIQAITYEEWLPTLGVKLPIYSGYKSHVNPAVSVLFSGAAFRLGHTLLSSRIVRMDNKCNPIEQGDATLMESFFNPSAITEAGGIDPLLKGLSAQIMQELDCKVIDDVRNFLFGPPGEGVGMDLASININRGRELGLPDYNTIRRSLGMPPAFEFSDICSEPEVVDILVDLYGDVESVDAWVGLLAEDHMPGALFGQTLMHIMSEQFSALRDGDRFYYENDPAFTSEEIEEIKNTTLGDVIKRNSSIRFMQENVFYAEPDCEFNELVDEEFLDMRVYPNPTPDYFNLAVFSTKEGTADMRIINTLGQLVFYDKIQLENGVNVFRFSLDGRLSQGNYIVQVSFDGSTNTRTLQKVEN